jgi:hypothetical protein
MNKVNFLTTILILVSWVTFAQKTEIITKTEKKYSKTGNDFAYIVASTDTNKIEFVAKIRATGVKKQQSIQSLYFSILDQAKTLGANSFKLVSFTRSDENSKDAELILDTYFADDSTLNLNFVNHEKNVVYIFGGENPNGTETYSFKVNDEKKTIKSGTYFKEFIKEGQELKVNKGGFTGMTAWFKWKPDKQATFLTLTGLGLGGGSVPNQQIGVSFNTGRLNSVNGHLGCLIAQILTKSE